MSVLPSSDFHERILDVHRRVVKFRSASYILEARRRFFWSLTATVGTVLVILGLEALGHFSTVVRTASFIVVIGVAGFAAGLTVAPCLRAFGFFSPEDVLSVSRRLGRSFGVLRDRLTSALELGASPPDAEWVSSELSAEFIRSVHVDCCNLDLSSSLDARPARIAGKASFAVAVSFLAAALVFPQSMGDAAFRVANFSRSFVSPPRYILVVSPGTREIVKGTVVDVRVDIRTPSGDHVTDPPEVVLRHRVGGQETFDRTELMRDSAGGLSATLGAVRMTTEYFAATASIESERCTLTVLDRPVIQSLSVRLEPPAYARLPVRTQEEFVGNIVALSGTRVTLVGVAQKPIRSAVVRFQDSSATALEVRETRFQGGFTLLSAGSYFVSVADPDGLHNAAPVVYSLTILNDEMPSVRILEPGRNVDIAGSEPIGLIVHASDDYGVASLKLAYRLSHSRYEQPDSEFTSLALPLSTGNPLDIESRHQWDLSNLNLVPEDVVEYFAEAADNNSVSAPGIARSPVYTLRLPSLEEVFTDLDRSHDENVERLQTALEEAQEMKEELERLSQDLKKNKDFDWQKQQQTGEMARKAAETQKKLDDVRQQVEAMTQQMQQQQVLSPKTLEKYLELQNLFTQMDTQELQKALRQMQQSMQNVDREQLRQAIERAQFSEERFRESIERTINLLKRIQVEQKVDEVRKRAQELADQQKELANQSKDSSGLADADAHRQEELAPQEQRLEQEVQELQNRMDEFFTEMPADKLAGMNAELREKGLSQKMRQAAHQLRQGQRTEAQRQQTETEQALRDFADQMESLQREMLEEQGRHLTQTLRRVTHDLLELSRRQEALKNQSQSAGANSPELRQNAQDQQRVIQDLSNVLSSLDALAQKSFVVTPGMGKALGEALNNMQNAMRDLDLRNGAMAGQDQTGAMASLNRAVQQVQDALQAMQQGQGGMPGGMGLMQQLQLMAGQQMSLNMQTQRLGEGAGEAMRRAAEAARLAREQDAVRKSLEQLNREAQGSADSRRILGDLQRIADEMREVIRDLEQADVNPETIRQQERILSRLLDASRSMRERDFEKKRRATTGQPGSRKSPGEVDEHALDSRSRLREDLLRALEEGYSRDFQGLIRKYFEALEKEGTTEGR